MEFKRNFYKTDAGQSAAAEEERQKGMKLMKEKMEEVFSANQQVKMNF